MTNGYNAPDEIEKRSFEIIRGELKRPLKPTLEPVILRVIHATADFDFAESLAFSANVPECAAVALRRGADIISDTNMVMAGVDKKRLNALGGEVRCFMADEDVQQAAKSSGCTRAKAAIDKAAFLYGGKPVIFAVGNAPTALLRICKLREAGIISPALVIGVPVGFVNVVESKEALMRSDIPYITARGRKGGSSVAAAIVNALLRIAHEA